MRKQLSEFLVTVSKYLNKTLRFIRRVIMPAVNKSVSSSSSTHSALPIAGRIPKTSRKTSVTDALSLLRNDHETVTALFEKFENAKRSDQKLKLASTICTELKIHAQIEEEIFYPELREIAADTDDMLDEADVEHDGAKKLIAEIEESEPEDQLFDARIKVLSEYIRHHIKEEHSKIFPAARKSGLDLTEMGERLTARKQELKHEL